MEKNEKRVLAVSIALMVVFFIGLIHAYRAYGVRIPSCVTELKPFDEGKVIRRGEKDYEVHIVARMWSFEPAEVVLPPGAHVTIYLSSVDVVHGFQIVGTNVNLMAVPGTVNVAEVRFDRAGSHLGVCHEFCGLGHERMANRFVIREAPIEEPVTPAPPAAAEALPGQELFDKYDCLACHTLDGTEGLGPSFKGLFGTVRTMSDGTQVTADAAYLIESIRDPNKKIAKGYDPDSMPLVEVPEQDLEAMVDALGQLSD
jgi:cytochrome c oxidase subunit 2